MTDTLYQIATWLVPLTIAIVFHEVSHGWVARALGDPTAAERGRLTLNPVRHVDPVGTIGLPLLLALANAPIFGWAKPVPVDYRRLGHPRRDMVLVALAGPGMNFALALLAVAVLGAALPPEGVNASPGQAFVAANALNFLLINLFLAVFNLIPLPPFDGGHVVEGALPPRLALRFARLGRFALPLLIVLLLVLPMIDPSLDIVDRWVRPVVEQVARGYLSLIGLR